MQYILLGILIFLGFSIIAGFWQMIKQEPREFLIWVFLVGVAIFFVALDFGIFKKLRRHKKLERKRKKPKSRF